MSKYDRNLLHMPVGNGTGLYLCDPPGDHKSRNLLSKTKALGDSVPGNVKSREKCRKKRMDKLRLKSKFYVISIFPSHAPGSLTTFPTTCAPFTIFSTAATLAFGTT